MLTERTLHASKTQDRKRSKRLNGRAITRPSQQNAKVVITNDGVGLVWHGPAYPTLDAGLYTVRGVSVQGPQWLRNYQRWSIRIEFALTAEPGNVSAFFNLGSDKAGPKIGRQSRYYKAWVLAHGEHPREGERMDAEVFCEGQFFEVEVESCNSDENGQLKSEAEAYSRVTRIVRAWTA